MVVRIVNEKTYVSVLGGKVSIYKTIFFQNGVTYLLSIFFYQKVE